MIADGKHIAQQIEERLLGEFANAPLKKVCFVLFGNDPASIQFIKIKTNIAERLGIKVDLVTGPQNMITDQALGLMDEVNKKDYDGIVVQLPLPKQLDTDTILNEIPADKDIDVLGLGVEFGKKVAPVARAVFEILDFYNISLENKKVLVVGNGRLVGKPVGSELSRRGISYQMVDKDTDDDVRNEKIQSADVIISGAGVPHMIKPDMIKDGVVLIDAGTSEQSGVLVGDIDPACGEKASLITPVPGGVGPVTVVSLFANLL
jgi:methylenetetrahydrofolate dehydrogenase (NADP+)/methenyltetrahydrofolate cyclohydrolase